MLFSSAARQGGDVERTYHFTNVLACEMCGAPASQAKVTGQRLNQSQGKRPRSKTGISVTVCQCVDCGLVFANPLPRPHKLSDHYDVPPENYWNNLYFTVDPEYFARQIADAKRLLNNPDTIKALDIGVGIGKAVVAMRNAGFDVYGLEPSEPFYRKAIEFTGLGEDRLRWSSVEETEYEPETFDFITFGAVLEHLYEPSTAIERAMRWLKPGGVMQLEVPSSDHLVSKIINAYYRTIGTNYVTNLSPMHSPFHIYEFSLDSFRYNGRRTGYDIAHHYYEVCSIINLPRFVHPLLRSIMAKTNTGMQLTVWLAKK